MRTKWMFVIGLVLGTSSVLAITSDLPEDRGAMGLAQVLGRLDVVGSVLHTGAHPDDENSSLLAWLSRGQGLRTAYLSATRGDGGQNLLGSELFEALGVIRTEELLAARRADRAQQFFTPNYEFGFSKTAEETFEKWGRERVLGDFVRVIRHYRPEIVIARFTGTPRDGHGHHQVAGIITREAFKAAADPALFPEYGKPWQARKLYLNSLGGDDPRGGLTINVGEFDQALGRSYHEIAMEGRSLHRSQSQGAAQEKGPRTTNVSLIDRAGGVPEDGGLFAGTTHRLTDLGSLDRALANDLGELQRQIGAIRSRTGSGKPSDIAADLSTAFTLFRRIKSAAKHEHVQFLLNLKEADFHEALRLSTGVNVDFLASDETLTAGQEFDVTITVVNGGPMAFGPAQITFPQGVAERWNYRPEGPPAALAAGQRVQIKAKMTVPRDHAFSQPYWLRESRSADRFAWPAGSAALMPFDPAFLSVHVRLTAGATDFSVVRDAQFRRVDNIYGELRSALHVLPAYSVQVAPDIAIVPVSGTREKEFTVTVENQDPVAGEAEVSLNVPSGWLFTPQTGSVRFSRQGEKASVRFLVTVPNREGDFKVSAVVRPKNHPGTEFRSGYTLVAYPHIGSHYLFAPAESKVEVFDVRTSVQNVGYVEGAGDRVAEYLRQLGLNVTMLSTQDLATGDLSRFQTIVLGIRAYAVRDDLRAYNGRLLAYVRNGGTVINQYNTYEILEGQFGPFPFTIKRPHDRVTKEEAEVRILDPRHAVFNSPNKIGSADFDGWVQERGLYFLETWDPQYKPLLESHDPGEPPKQGGMVAARYGNGIYVYTGYGFFRQLPAGVKGAYRLFANLVSLVNQ